MQRKDPVSLVQDAEIGRLVDALWNGNPDVAALERATIRALREVPDAELPALLSELLFSHYGSRDSSTEAKLHSLSNLDPKRRCNYMFQLNDIAWNCHTCQADDTCVLCMDCFKQGDHTGHEVYFHRTKPGGFCDCGDEEAWDPRGFCIRHAQAQLEQDPLAAFPSDLAARAQVIFSKVVRYLYDSAVAVYKSYQEEWVSSFPEGSLYSVILHNDDVHTFDEVRIALRDLGCPDYAELPNEVDSVGQATVKRDVNLRDALAALQHLQSVGLLASLADSARYAMESKSVALIKWLQHVCDKSEGLRYLAGQAFTVTDPELDQQTIFGDSPLQTDWPCPPTLLGTMLKVDPYLKKDIGVLLHALYMRLLADLAFKRHFAVDYTRSYAFLSDRYVRGIGTGEETVFNSSVQLYTSPSLVRMLQDDGLLEILLDSLIAAMELTRGPGEGFDAGGVLASEALLNPRHPIFEHRWYQNTLRDVEYVLHIPGQAARMARMEPLVKRYLHLLMMAQGIDPHTRQTGSHVEHESRDWIQAFYLSVGLSSTFSVALKGLREGDQDSKSPDGGDGKGASTIAKEVQSKATAGAELEEAGEVSVARSMQFHLMRQMDSWLQQQQFQTFEVLSVPPLPRLTLPQWNMLSDPVSLHIPLHRFFARFLLELCTIRYDKDGNPLVGNMDTRPYDPQFVRSLMREWAPDSEEGERLRLGIIDFPLRAFSLVSGIHAGLWRRNGLTMINQMINYCGPPLCRELRDLDLILLQFGVLELGPDGFFAMFLKRFGMLRWFLERKVDDGAPGDFQDYASVLAEECLLSVIWVLTELPHPPLPTRESVCLPALRREIIHRLAVGPCSFSELLESLPQTSEQDSSSAAAMKVVQEVAIRRNSGSGVGTDVTKYELKPELYAELDPCFYHLTRSQHEAALERRTEQRKRTVGADGSRRSEGAGDTFLTVPYPISARLPQAHPAFLPVRMLVLRPAIFTLVRNILFDTLHEIPQRHREVLLARTVQLLTIQMHCLVDPSFLTAYIAEAGQEGETGVGKSLVAQVVSELKFKATFPSTQSTSETATQHYSILTLLHGINKKKPMPASSTADGIHWLLDQYAALDSDISDIIQTLKEVRNEDEKLKREAMRKNAQQQAMLAMQQRQAAFAKMMTDMDWSDEEEGEDALQSTEKPKRTALTCIMCHEKTDGLIGFLGFTQTSVLWTDQSQFLHPPTRSGAYLHTQFCGHALHFECWDVYFASLIEKSSSGAHYEGRSAVQIEWAEFLCPLCKTISNILVPHLSTLDGVDMSTDSVATSADSTCEWFVADLPHLLMTHQGDDYKLAAGGNEALEAQLHLRFLLLTEQFVDVGEGLREEDLRNPKRKSLQVENFEKFHTAWAAFAGALRCSEAMGSARANVTAIMKEKEGHSQLQDCLHGELEPWFRNEAEELARLFSSIRLLPKLLLSSEELPKTLVQPLMGVLGLRKPLASWSDALRDGFPLALCQSLYQSDGLYLLTAVTSLLPLTRRNVQMSCRTLALASLGFHLLASMTPNQESNPSSARDTVHSIMVALEDRDFLQADDLLALRQILAAEANVVVPADALGGNSLVEFVALGWSSFLRQISLFQRVLFSLEELRNTMPGERTFPLSISCAEMCKNLGVTAPKDLAGSHENLHLLKTWAEQWGTGGSAAGQIVDFSTDMSAVVPAEARNAFLSGKLEDARVKLLGRGEVRKRKSPSYSLDAAQAEYEAVGAQEQKALEPMEIDGYSGEDRRYRLFLPSPPLRVALTPSGALHFINSYRLNFCHLAPSYTELYAAVVSSACSSCGETRIEDPAICLLCGAFLCAGRKVDNVGECTLHSLHCRNATGMFFLILKCSTLLIRGSKASYFSSFYVDAFGEEDVGLRRRRPLFLNAERLKAVWQLWTGHLAVKEIARSRSSSDRVIRAHFY